MMTWPSLASCVLFSQIAYDDDLTTRARLGQLGFPDVTTFQDQYTDTAGYWASTSLFDVIAFKGTSSLTDFLVDTEIVQTRWNGMGIHTGFLEAWRNVAGYVADAGHRRTLIVGHSLGGAIATLAAHGIAGEGHSVRCVTFGSPRVGDDAFAVDFNRLPIDSVRVVHHDDIVPRVPNIFYHHVDGLLHLDDHGHASSGLMCWWRRLIGWDRMLHEEARLLLADVDGQALADHELANYAAAVNAYLMKGLSDAP